MLMKEIVFIENDRVVTDSLTVAEVFGKNHKDVLRDIDNQIEKLNEADEKEFSQRNFAPSDYINERGRQYRKYLLTEEGFTLVTMAYTTVEAMRFKVRFINEFNRMKEELKRRHQPNNALQQYLDMDENDRAIAYFTERKQRIETQKQLAIAAPKAEIFDVIATADNAQPISAVAKSFNWGRNRMFAFLRDKKVLMKSNEPYQEYIDRGYFKVRQVPVAIKNSTVNKTQTLVTAKGIEFIGNMLRDNGLLKKVGEK
jgi:anti-repressor protein